MMNLDKQEELLKDKKFSTMITDICFGGIVFCNTEEECINSIINSELDCLEDEDFEECDDIIYTDFINYVANTYNVHISLYEYVQWQYKNYYTKYEDYYVVNKYKPFDSDSFDKLLKITQSKNKEDIINFCEKYKDIVEKNF